MEKIETTFYTEADTHVVLDEWDDGGVWLKIGVRNGGAYTPLTRQEAQQMLKNLQAILNKEVTA